ncbi:MAG: hypothetical protein IJM51_00035 [Clostridia bacterium]|nr:hypothetical protein [Clostridia bacterium]
MNNRKKKSSTPTLLLPFASTALILLLAVSTVAAVNAYLTAITNTKNNSFEAMNYTYTDVEIHEPNGQNYTVNISNGSLYKTGGDSSETKKAAVVNPAGRDKKPVFIRVAVTTDIYDSNGVNITRTLPGILPQFTQGSITNACDDTHHIPANASGSWANEADVWTPADTGKNLVYFYYNAIVVPGDETFNLFDSVSLSGDLTQIPNGAEVRIRIITDAVQAVAIDTDKWTAENYTSSEVPAQWAKKPVVDTSGMTPAQKAGRTPWAISWTS